jgi:hypothetical protein
MGALLLWALSLFHPGELVALRVKAPEMLDLILPSVDASSLRATAPQALGPLCALGWSQSANNGSNSPIFGFIERYAATLTELDCPILFMCSAANRALARCTRLESLASASRYTPAAWLGLSQLHTLRGVDFFDVPAATIADALPRLHTLVASIHPSYGNYARPAAVCGFFEKLLPRLRSFRFYGIWPKAPLAAIDNFESRNGERRLPRLEELAWDCSSADVEVGREFLGAQPMLLLAPHAIIVDWIVTAAAGGGFGGGFPLAQVRDLTLTTGLPEAADVAQVLRAALQLRRLSASIKLCGGYLWASDAAFEGVTHPHLRSLCITVARNAAPPCDDCAALLRQLHFPQLRSLTVNGYDYMSPLSGTG